MKKDNGYIIVPNKFVQNNKLSIHEKMLFLVLFTYRGMDKIFPSYETLSEQAGIKRTKLIETIRLLEEKKHIKVLKDSDHKTNVYQILKRLPVRETDVDVRYTDAGVRDTDGVGSPRECVPVRHTDPNIKSINNKSIIKDSMSGKKKKPPPDHIPYSEIIDFLNKTCSTKYKASTPKARTLINARIKEGFTLEDFKKVIRNQHSKWKDTDMAQYLRPSTLFSPKFEGYLNAPIEVSGNSAHLDNSPRVPYFKPERDPTPEEVEESRKLAKEEMRKVNEMLNSKPNVESNKDPKVVNHNRKRLADIVKNVELPTMTDQQMNDRRRLLQKQAEQVEKGGVVK